MEYTSGASSWRRAVGRLIGVLASRRRAGHRRGWSALVPVVAAMAGLLFTTTARTAGGTELRTARPELPGLIAERRRQIASADARAAALRHEIERQTDAQARSDARVAEQRARADALRTATGLPAQHGPGLTVRLDDAARRADGSLPVGARPDDLVVHQQDVQAVVNALWAGGAEGMAIMGVRVISTSAVRCVGNTLLLDGRVYSPPFVVVAIGDAQRLERALDAAQGVRLFREAAAAFGLGYDVKVEADVTLPAYDGSIALRSASVPS